jgi:heme/copper-type cytochrome/quinol oxidase subunit 1
VKKDRFAIESLYIKSLAPKPGNTGDLVDSNTYNKFFTMHGIIMVFLLPDPVDSGHPR